MRGAQAARPSVRPWPELYQVEVERSGVTELAWESGLEEVKGRCAPQGNAPAALASGGGKQQFPHECRLHVQGDPCGRGKDYVDIKFKVPSQAWVAGQPYS